MLALAPSALYGEHVKMLRSLLPFVPLLALAACRPQEQRFFSPPLPSSQAPAPAPTSLPGLGDAVPLLRLPSHTRPLAQNIELFVDPRAERYRGTVDITVELSEPRGQLWLHGNKLHVTQATVTPAGAAPIAASYNQRHESGVASLRLASAAPAGKASIHIDFDAALGTGDKGFYRVTESGTDYAFTQFEALGARLAFPCFDEPGFKIPFTTTLVIPSGSEAVANTRELGRRPDGAAVRVQFAPTLPIPSYLVAFAVGPLDFLTVPDVPVNAVRKRTLPLRGVAPRGRAKEMAYAMAHTGEILAELERYTGVEYPYDKLDMIAIPGKRGAMENPGAVTFGEYFLMFDPAKAPMSQRRTYAGIVAHELAHQWTGDLVTMQWWDDLWLNEAFATWLGNKIADIWDPKVHAGLDLLRATQGAMGSDALVSARAIRQPITSTHDIENAFDGITYQKGGTVLGMFERWAGPEAWQKGLHDYLEKHRFGSATADDFLDAENAATGKDVKSAFHTFLDQPGVPFLTTKLRCGGGQAALDIEQSRFFPLGSDGDPKQSWRVPVCVRYAADKGPTEVCTLLTETRGSVALPGTACPRWVFPNADAAGYLRFALEPAELAALGREGLPALNTREKIAYANSVRAGYARGVVAFADVMGALAPLTRDPDPAVAREPMGYLSQAREWLYTDPLRARVEAYARELYAPVVARLGWDPRPGESDETRALRAAVLGLFSSTAHDGAVRAEAERRGLAYIGYGKDGELHPEVVDADLVGITTGVLGEQADLATWKALRRLFDKNVDEAVRGRLLWALSSGLAPELVSAARDLVFDPALRSGEATTPLYAQLDAPETRDATWAWVKEHYDAIAARLPQHHGAVSLVSLGGYFCDAEHGRDVEAFFRPKIEAIEGGPRTLAGVLEDIKLCSARRAKHEASVRAFFQRH